MNSVYWVLIAGMAAFVVASAVWQVARWFGWLPRTGDGAALSARSAGSENRVHAAPSPHIGTLEDERLMDSSVTCFRCHHNRVQVHGLWCNECAELIHEIDQSDERPMGEK